MLFKNLKIALSDTSNWKCFILTAIALRGVLWLYFGHLVNVHLPDDQKLYAYFVKDDYLYFFDPVDNFFRTGTFSYSGNIPFTGRMPGYSIVYFLFRLVCSKQIAAYGVVLSQFILSSASVYVLALTASKMLKSRRSFYITFCLYVLAVFPGFFDFVIVPESFSVSALIFTFYFITRYIKDGYNAKHLLLSGTFLTWAIFLREYTGLLIVLIPLMLGIHVLFTQKESLLKAIKVMVLFCLPFIIADGIWITRNYVDTGKIIPLESNNDDAYGKLYSSSWSAIDNLIFSWGEDGSPFNTSGIAFYYRNPLVKNTFVFPKQIFNNVTTYNVDSLVSLRNLYATYYYTKDTALEKVTEQQILTRCAIYKYDYVSHNAFMYWVIKPVKGLKYFMLFSGTGYLPMPPFSACNLIEKLIKVVFCVLYFVVLTCALLGVLLFLIRYRVKNILLSIVLLSCITVTGVIIFYCASSEPRYSVHVFMLAFIFAAYFIDSVMNKNIDKL